MATALREPTLATLGLGGVLEIFQTGKRPRQTADLVDEVFGGPGDRGALVISGANGIVGAGKTMQLGSRLQPFGVPIVALDFPGAPDGIGAKYGGLVRAFGRDSANQVMQNIVQIRYDGTQLPSRLSDFKPRFLLEAIPEILEIKKAHYDIFRAEFPEIEIRSVTSGFPSSQLGVGIAHPAFPHEINKVWEIVEPEPSAVTQLLWSLGMIPIPVSDDWSFVLDVLFCGITHAALQFHQATNMPFWKIDKFVRRSIGPNPFRAHDAIGAKGANFLTWSCLFHLGKEYGDLFTPTTTLEVHKETGQTWYPPNHFRPLVNWSLEDVGTEELDAWVLGPLFQMTSLMLHEKRAHLSHLNIIGELCAQFRRGILAVIRETGPDKAAGLVAAYHARNPSAARKGWYPDAMADVSSPEWQQLYVNAEHDGNVGVISIGRESYNADVDAELNRAVDWLIAEKIRRVIVTGDFHLSTQMIGADTNEFFPALEKEQAGFDIASSWSRTARRLHDEFETSVGFIDGKRCMGGFLELMEHCHYLVAVEDAALGMPEVTLPVVPGMEGCHWPLRKVPAVARPKLIEFLLSGRSVKARDAVGWLVDYAGGVDDAVATAWKIASGTDHGVALRQVERKPLSGIAKEAPGLPPTKDAAANAARAAILETIAASCAVGLDEALELQARHSAGFMTSGHCRRGVVGTAFAKTMKV